MRITYVFDLGGVLIKLNVGRCMRAFEALMGEQNMRAVLGMPDEQVVEICEQITNDK